MTTECIHHWIIEMPDGPVSIGTCKKCGREREYENFKYGEYNSRPTTRPPVEDQSTLIWSESREKRTY